MDVGFPTYPVERLEGDTRPLAELYKEGVDLIVKLEDLGFDFATAAEHHFLPSQWNPSPLMILAAAARLTSRIRLGTNVILTPMYHPVRLSEDIATLDLLSNGRVDIVHGSGSIRTEFETLGLDPDERFGRMWETIDLIKRSFEEDQFDYFGKHHHYPNIRQTTKPVQSPFPIWWSGQGPKSFERCGKLGYGVRAGLGQTTGWGIYRKALEEAGRPLESVNMGAGINLRVGANEAEVAEWRDQYEKQTEARRIRYAREGRVTSLQRPGGPTLHTHPEEQIPPFFGTPDQLLKQLEPYLKDGPYTHFVLGRTPLQALFVKEVMPTLKTWGRQPIAGTGAK